VCLTVSSLTDALGKVTESNVDELLGVQVSVPVGGAANGSGKSLSSSVDSLPDVLEVDSAGDFLNQDGSDSEGSQLLVGTEEVDLSHEDGLALDSHVNGDSRDEGVECSLGLVSDADDPLGVEARGVESPLQEGGGVVESEFTIIVFNIMVNE